MVRNGKRRKMAGLSWRVVMAGCHGELEGRVSEPIRPSFHKSERKADPIKRSGTIQRNSPALGQIGAAVGLVGP